MALVGSSVLGHWLAELLVHAAAKAQPPAAIQPAARDQGVEPFGSREGPRRLVLVRHPGRELMDAIAGGQVPVVAALDDPVDSVRFTKAVLAPDILSALREQTSHACANHLLPGNAAVLVLHRGFKAPAHEAIAKVLEHFALHLPPADLQELLETFGGPMNEPWRFETALERRAPHYARLDRLAEAVSAEEAKLVRQVLSPMALGALDPDIGPITWPTGVFLSGDRPNEVAPSVADVTGAARIIYYGPYFHLPPGTYKVRLIVAFSPQARGTPFRLTVYSNQKPLTKVFMRPADGGAFECAFTLQHQRPEFNVEIHLMNDEGTIEGHIALGQMVFSRLAL